MPGRRVERDRHAGHRLDQRQAAGQRLIAAGEWILSRGVEDDDLDAARQRRQRLGEIRNPYRLQRNVDIALDIGVDRNEIILAVELQTDAGEIDQRHRIRSGGRHLADEFTKGFPQRRLIEIARAGDGEAGGLQRVGDQTGVVGGGGKFRGSVFVVADHQREALFRRLARVLTERQRQDDEQPQGCRPRKFCHSDLPDVPQGLVQGLVQCLVNVPIGRQLTLGRLEACSTCILPINGSK